MLREYYDYETFQMVYILVISTLGKLLNQKFPLGILGYRNEKNRARQIKFPNVVSFLLWCNEPMTCLLHALAARVKFDDENE